MAELVRALARQAARSALADPMPAPRPAEPARDPKMNHRGNSAGHKTSRSASGFSKVRQVAEKTQYSERQVRRWIADGDLPVHRFGRSIRVSDEDLEVFIASRRRVKK